MDTTPIIANGTIYFTTEYFQIFALNMANGDILRIRSFLGEPCFHLLPDAPPIPAEPTCLDYPVWVAK